MSSKKVQPLELDEEAGARQSSIQQEELAAIENMGKLTLNFVDPATEEAYRTYLLQLHARGHPSDYSRAFQGVVVLSSILFIAIYDVVGAAGGLSDSKEMKNYYTDRTQWDAAVAIIWCFVFVATNSLRVEQPALWRTVCFVAGPLVFVLKEGCNMTRMSDRFGQLARAQPHTAPWAPDALELAEGYLVNSYFTGSVLSSVFLLLLTHLLLRFDWLCSLLSTSTMAALTIALSVMLERKVTEPCAGRLAFSIIFTTIAASLFCAFSYYSERLQRAVWFKANPEFAPQLTRTASWRGGAAGANVSEMEGIINTLVALQKRTGDPKLKIIISKLRAGTNWEMANEDMKEMPVWLQEQDQNYMARQAADMFLKKHFAGRAKAYEVKDAVGTVWVEGDNIKVTKVGNHTGKTGVVIEPDWNGRIRVTMDVDGTIKSYMANEIVKQLKKAPSLAGGHLCEPRLALTPRTVNRYFSDAEVDEWGFDVLGVQEKLCGGGAGPSKILSLLGMHLFERHKAQNLGVDMGILSAYLQQLEALYVANPYHNAFHGADCMRSIHYFFVHSELAGARQQSPGPTLGGALDPLVEDDSGSGLAAQRGRIMMGSRRGSADAREHLLTDVEIFSGLLAGAVHDVKHPGVNTMYLCNTSDPIAITYNDNSPLENMHCATAFELAGKLKLLASLPVTMRRVIRKQVVSMVLQTDLARHFSTLAQFKAKLSKYEAKMAEATDKAKALLSPPLQKKSLSRLSFSGLSITPNMNDEGGVGAARAAGAAGLAKADKPMPSLLKLMVGHVAEGEGGAGKDSQYTEERIEVLCLCIKSSDIGHAAKPWALHERWSKRVLAEFFDQGDKEREAGLAISSLCDRETEQVFKGQIGFIDFLAMPLAKAWCQCLGSAKVSKDILGTMESNRAKWAQLKEEAADETPFKDKAQLRRGFFEVPPPPVPAPPLLPAPTGKKDKPCGHGE